MRTGPFCVFALALSQRLRRLRRAGLQVKTYMFRDSHNNAFGVYALRSLVRVATREEVEAYNRRCAFDSLPPPKIDHLFLVGRLRGSLGFETGKHLLSVP